MQICSPCLDHQPARDNQGAPALPHASPLHLTAQGPGSAAPSRQQQAQTSSVFTNPHQSFGEGPPKAKCCDEKFGMDED